MIAIIVVVVVVCALRVRVLTCSAIFSQQFCGNARVGSSSSSASITRVACVGCLRLRRSSVCPCVASHLSHYRIYAQAAVAAASDQYADLYAYTAAAIGRARTLVANPAATTEQHLIQVGRFDANGGKRDARVATQNLANKWAADCARCQKERAVAW